MTIIAWDGKTLAADKRGTWQGISRTVTKIFRTGDWLIGIAGNQCEGYDMVEWLKNGAAPDKFPVNQRDEKLWISCLVISSDGLIRLYERSPNPCIIENEFTAIGSGRDFALAAMYLGLTSREAVEVACEFEEGCGNGIDELNFNEVVS